MIDRVHSQRQSHLAVNDGPLDLIGDLIVTAKILNDAEKSVEIEVTGGDLRTLVNGSATVVHELVELSYKAIFLFTRLIIRRLD